MKPKLYAEMNLVFSKDFDLSILSDITGIETATITPPSSNLSPLTGKNIEASWSIQTTCQSTYDLADVLEELVQLVTPHIPVFIDLCKRYSGDVNFCIVADFYTEQSPALYFERDFLDIVNKLNATIQIDMYPE